MCIFNKNAFFKQPQKSAKTILNLMKNIKKY